MKKLNSTHWILIIFAFLALFYFTFLNEYFAYKDVLDKNTIDQCKVYYSEFPTGRHIEDVMFIEVKHTDNIKYHCWCDNEVNWLDSRGCQSVCVGKTLGELEH